MIRFVRAILTAGLSRPPAPPDPQSERPFHFLEGVAKLAQSRQDLRHYLLLSIGIAVTALGLSIAISALAIVYAEPATDDPLPSNVTGSPDGFLSPTPPSSLATSEAEANATADAPEGESVVAFDSGPNGTAGGAGDPSALAAPICASDALVPVPTIQPTPTVGRAPSRSPTPVPTNAPPASRATAKPGSPAGKSPTPQPPPPTRVPPTATPTPRPKPSPTPRIDPTEEARNWLPTGRIKNANITFYDCYVDDFCGHMFNGITVYEGAAACSWNLGIGTRFRIVGDPTERAYRCDDRGLLSNTWVDIFFWDPADGWDWQAKVGRCATLEILAPRF